MIGIGPGNPRQITLEAIDAIAACDVFFLLDKGARVQQLSRARTELLAAYAPAGHRVVVIDDPPRDRDPDDYRAEVQRWHTARVDALETAIIESVDAGQSCAFLVWGDPALYDSTLRLVDQLVARGSVDLEVEVIPGVTSASALTAAHGIVAHGIGEPVLLTTGRRLVDAAVEEPANRIVMLDSHLTFTQTARSDDDVYWGANLGTPEQVLISGKVSDVADEIEQARARLRQQTGWVMDIYLLRRR
ncbi:precorrin-6A synthase [Gordonia hirsuta DSM 44140 = NBRC 16056]|uniref:Precorrin-6A synthase n=1 Tax=Gordonia hirsuta DSM 44140 = NBRC 16056 TaxID=1121927 RepID=L7L9V9_9ACTN|nr:precorrin-6A synthase (deacetylating) [Gordonia hirsuta]GAC57511.1 precorrin-6A synthase [Gordonia hirsuta DSM 44140 = NBRC 16056]